MALGPSIPSGWRLVGGTGKQLDPDPAEQVVIELAREFRRAGCTLQRCRDGSPAVATSRAPASRSRRRRYSGCVHEPGRRTSGPQDAAAPRGAPARPCRGLRPSQLPGTPRRSQRPRARRSRPIIQPPRPSRPAVRLPPQHVGHGSPQLGCRQPLRARRRTRGRHCLWVRPTSTSCRVARTIESSRHGTRVEVCKSSLKFFVGWFP